MKARRAWIITWDIAADARDGVEAGQVLTFLDARLRPKAVIAIMKALWISHRRLHWDERLAFATKRTSLPSTFAFERSGSIYVGGKPRLVARVGTHLEVLEDLGENRISWRDKETDRVSSQRLRIPE